MNISKNVSRNRFGNCEIRRMVDRVLAPFEIKYSTISIFPAFAAWSIPQSQAWAPLETKYSRCPPSTAEAIASLSLLLNIICSSI